MPDASISVVSDDARDFYGRDYWFRHQTEDLGYPDIQLRARLDMPERCLWWLRALLKYKAPPGRALELGASHGGFVALLRWTGFDATGLELSPWIVEYARRTFGVRMLEGPIEHQQLDEASFEAIALMDVLEHLPDPAATMAHSVRLLKPDGLLLIQTPRYPEGALYADLKKRDDPFLIQLKPEQHLYLFSESSARRLFAELGSPHIAFEPAIFGQYDMFFAVSRAPLRILNAREVEQTIEAIPTGRLVLALIDLNASRMEIIDKLRAAEQDRTARLKVIEKQGAEVGRLAGELEIVWSKYTMAEEDRAARLTVIERLGEQIGSMGEQIGALDWRMRTLTVERDSLQALLNSWRRFLPARFRR
jgi:SAM-dependent methyltransferase